MIKTQRLSQTATDVFIKLHIDERVLCECFFTPGVCSDKCLRIVLMLRRESFQYKHEQRTRMGSVWHTGHKEALLQEGGTFPKFNRSPVRCSSVCGISNCSRPSWINGVQNRPCTGFTDYHAALFASDWWWPLQTSGIINAVAIFCVMGPNYRCIRLREKLLFKPSPFKWTVDVPGAICLLLCAVWHDGSAGLRH